MKEKRMQCGRKWGSLKDKGEIMHSPIELLECYFCAIIEHPIFKSLVAAFVITFEYLFGGFGNPLSILVVLVGVDLATGIAKAGKKQIEINGHTYMSAFCTFCSIITSKGLRNGGWKIVEYLAAVFFANAITVTMNAPALRTYVITFLALTEIISIAENMSVLGFDVPFFTPAKLRRWKKKIVKEVFELDDGGDNN